MKNLKYKISKDKMKVLANNSTIIIITIIITNNKYFLLLKGVSLELPNTDHLGYQHSECFSCILYWTLRQLSMVLKMCQM